MNALYEVNFWQLANHAVPLLFLIGVATVVLVADLWWREHDRTPLALATLLGLIFTGWLAWLRWKGAATAAGAAMLYFDRVTWMGGLLLVGATFLTVLQATVYLRDRQLPLGEFLALLLYGVSGMWIMIATTNLIMVFLGLETLSLSAYILAAYHRSERRSIEAGIKYFLLGAVASAFLLFGIAFLYGGTGAFDLPVIAQALASTPPSLAQLYTMIGIALLVVGFGFKIAAVPFQFWTPDVYEGAPLPVTAFFATGVKAGAFIALLRVAQYLAPVVGVPWTQVVCGLAVVTMTVGNLAALVQNDVKRMLAYSSIAHAGYALIAIVIVGGSSLLFYLAAYAIMTLGAFAVLTTLATDAHERTTLTAFTGLGTQRPWLAAMMTIFLLSLAGIPPTIGFFGKYYLFQAAVAVGHVWLVVIAVLNSVLSVAYYVRPIIAMYFRPAEGPASASARATPAGGLVPLGVRVVLVLTCAAVLLLGLFPTPLLDILKISAHQEIPGTK